MFDYSPADDNSEAAWVDSHLYSDQTADNFTPYAANGFGRTIYSVGSVVGDTDTLIYEGTDYEQAERLALNAFERSHRKAWVYVNADGGSWKNVFAYPSHIKGVKPLVIDAGSCPDYRCGQINPLECWCRYSMTPESIARYKTYY
ncbi:hypothetical protein [Streptomyces sp. NPDC048489]|uniref:hypothetical protein n=1 Tax=Streptomyces sp. NPDC048489 TaxID=3154504 RepID=UPI00342EAEC7